MGRKPPSGSRCGEQPLLSMRADREQLVRCAEVLTVVVLPEVALHAAVVEENVSKSLALRGFHRNSFRS